MFGCDFPVLRYEKVIADWTSEGYPQAVLDKVLFATARTLLRCLSIGADDRRSRPLRPRGDASPLDRNRSNVSSSASISARAKRAPREERMTSAIKAVRYAVTAFAVACSLTLSHLAVAQERFPSKPIRLIVPFNARRGRRYCGAANRAIDIRETQSAGRHREPSRRNRGDRLARGGSRPPDGYTILMAVISSHAVAPARRETHGASGRDRNDYVPFSGDAPAMTAVVSRIWISSSRRAGKIVC